MEDQLMTVGETARYLHVHANSIRRWCDEGILEPYYRIGLRGDRRIPFSTIEKFLQAPTSRTLLGTAK